MQGNGGTVSSSIVSDEAVKTVMSGPASGVMAAAYTSMQCGFSHVVTYDMGGTSCDVGLIADGIPQVTSELEIEYAMPIHVPMVDVHTIGAGGGSLAWVNEAGLLQVGPESAGAEPGPICYGRGGTKPTITDANLVLGRLNPESLLSVDNPVSIETVRNKIINDVGRKLGFKDVEETASAIIRIANMNMAGALRLVSLARGYDPRDFVLFAFGGAGPLHAVSLASELGIPKVLDSNARYILLLILFVSTKAIGISIYPFAVLIYLKSKSVDANIDSISDIKLLIFSSIVPVNFSSTSGISSFLIQFLIIVLSKFVTSSKY
jgi:N-methylhydantoinase A